MDPDRYSRGVRRCAALVTVAMVATLTTWLSASTHAHAASFEISGRVVLAATGTPPAPGWLGSQHWVHLYAGGDFSKPVASDSFGSDGLFELTSYAAPAGPYYALVQSATGGTILPTWHSGERAWLAKSSAYAPEVTAPVSTSPVALAGGVADLGDIAVTEGARVDWNNVDAAGNVMKRLLATAHSAESGRSESFQIARTPAPPGFLLEPGPQSVELVASPLKASGRRVVTVDPPSGHSTQQVDWPAEFYPQDLPRIDYDDYCFDGPALHPQGDDCLATSRRPARGYDLTAQIELSQVSLPNAAVKYRWHRGNKAIKKAKKRTYELRSADHGKSIRLRTRFKYDGYPTETYWSEPQRVAKTRAAVTTVLPTTIEKRHWGKKFAVRVRLANSSRPEGTVDLIVADDDGAIVIGTWKLRKKDRGTVRIKLRKKGRSFDRAYVRYVPAKPRHSNADLSRSSRIR